MNSIFIEAKVSNVTPKVGDYLMGSYGYEASIPVVAKVVAVTGASVKVREVELHSHSFTTGAMEWKVDVGDKLIGPTLTKRVKAGANGYRIKWNECVNLHGPWTPRTMDAYNYH